MTKVQADQLQAHIKQQAATITDWRARYVRLELDHNKLVHEYSILRWEWRDYDFRSTLQPKY